MSPFTVKTPRDFPILFFNDVPLHSIQHPIQEGRLLSTAYRVKDMPKALFLVGVGLGYVLNAWEICPSLPKPEKIVCLFYELEILQHFEWHRSSLGWGEEIAACLFSHKEDWESILLQFPPRDVGIWVHPIYQRLFPKESADIQDYFQLAQKRMLMNQLTDVAFGFRWWRNAIRNYAFGRGRALPSLKPLTCRPFLLIGSGFHTYEHLTELKLYQEYYWIMAAPPVLPLLQTQGIIPDIVVITDSAANNRFYDAVRNLPSTTILVGYGYVYPLVLEWFPGSIFFLNGGVEVEHVLTPSYPFLGSGGSVANTMLELAGVWGHDIYYTGFDFGYRQQHPHYPGAPLETNYLLNSSRYKTYETQAVLRVWGGESIPSKPYRTSLVLKSYGEYFEEQCKRLYLQGHTIAPWEDIRACQKNKKGNFLSKLEMKPYLSILSQEERRDCLGILIQYIERSLRAEEGWKDPLWKSLLARPIIKNMDPQKVLEREREYLSRIISVL